MTWVAVASAAIFITFAMGAAVKVIMQEAWGKAFDRELDRLVAGGTWIRAASTCEALSIDLIRRSDAASVRAHR